MDEPRARRIVVLGGTGRIGSEAVRAAMGARHAITVLSRRAVEVPGATVVVGDVAAADDVRRAVAGSDAVIAALGPRTNSASEEELLEVAMRNLVGAMSVEGVGRLVALSGAGVDVPGDHKPVVDRVVSRIVRVAARHVVGAKQREFEVFAASDLDWTALRPPLVTDGSARGYRLSTELAPGARVTRADVGRALVDQVTDRGYVRQAPFVLPPARG